MSWSMCFRRDMVPHANNYRRTSWPMKVLKSRATEFRLSPHYIQTASFQKEALKLHQQEQNLAIFCQYSLKTPFSQTTTESRHNSVRKNTKWGKKQQVLKIKQQHIFLCKRPSKWHMYVFYHTLFISAFWKWMFSDLIMEHTVWFRIISLLRLRL